MSAGRVRLLDVEPELGQSMGPGALEEARRLVALPVAELDRGAWGIADLAASAGVRGEVLGFAVLEGGVTMDVWIASRSCTRYLGPGEFLLLEDGEGDGGPVGWGWSVIVPARLALFDERLLGIGQRWPRLLAEVLKRAALQTHYALLQQAISQLPRVEDRLLALFWFLAERHGVMRADGMWVELPVTHDTIARMIGARRPTVTLALSALAERSMIRPEPPGWLIDRHSLEHFARPGVGQPSPASTKSRSGE